MKLAEEVTVISKQGVSESTYQNALKYFNEEQVAQMIFTVVVTNSWNRLAISMHMVAEQD